MLCKTEMSKQQEWVIEGPMGKGLDVQRSGIHLAFTAGTGVLPFLDLVAHLILLNSSHDSSDDHSPN